MEVFKFGFRQWKKRLALDILTKLLSFTALTADLLLPLLTAMFINYIIKEEQLVKGVVVHAAGRKLTFTAKAVIDATGNGDVAFMAGVPYESGRDGEKRGNEEEIF